MRISGGLSGAGARGYTQAGGGAGTSELSRSEMMADIFNNQPAEKVETPGKSRVHLSYAARALNNRLRESLKGYLQKNPDVKEKLQALELPDVESGEGTIEYAIRRVRSYLRYTESGAEPNPASPYFQLQQLGKDQELRDIIETHEKERAEFNTKRQQHAPNYYYRFFPETYSFN